MSQLLGRRLWNSLRKILFVLAVIALLIVAWEALVVAFPTLAEYSIIALLGTIGPVVTAAATAAATSPWLAAAVSIVVLGLIDPEETRRFIEQVGDITVETVESLATAGGRALASVLPDWLAPALVAIAAYLVLRNPGRA